ncbi:MAG: serine/threonine protein kinase, partial [Gemmataceae bacterium]
IKVLRRRWSEDQARIDLFIREGKVGLTLKHPNIVEVIAVNRDASSGQYFLVMEFVEGGNLREILQIRKKLSAAESLRILEDAASGLTYAYSHSMGHRDIKLTNLLISSTGEAKLVDFGLAQFFSTLAKKEDEKVDRTVDYAGLERATGVKFGDVRSDIYFLGCVFYEALTGRSPLSMTRDKHARMRKGRFEEVLPINPNEIDGPPSVLALLDTMMALEPKQRYQTPAQLLDAVKSVRREVEGKSANKEGQTPSRSVFVVESDEHLQDVLRDGLKDQGYRVLLAGDPVRALDRFRQQPYDGMIVDARTTGEEGLRVFVRVVEEAQRRRLPCVAVLLLGEEHASWAARLPTSPHVGFLDDHITFKTVSRKLKELMEGVHGPMEWTPGVSETRPLKPAERELETVPREAAVSSTAGDAAANAPDELSLSDDEDEAPSPPRPTPTRVASPPPMRPVAREPLSVPLPPHDPRSWRDEVGPLTGKEKKKKTGGGKLSRPWPKLSLTRNAVIGIVLTMVVLVGILVVTLGSGDTTEGKIDQIHLGLSEAEVEEILGGEGQPVETAGNPAGSKGVTKKKWVVGDKTIEITFRSGWVYDQTVK